MRQVWKGKRVGIVGLGNIGAPLCEHVARMADVQEVLLVDPDRYERRNLTSQAIAVRDLGLTKVATQERRMHAVNSHLRIETFADRVENVPLGRMRADVILACLDSKEARRVVSQMAWRLGVPWIDSGVEPSGLLARVNVYVPATHAPCLECAWDARDYAALPVNRPCLTGGNLPKTNAPSSLGALAAALQAIEYRKILDGRLEQAAVGQQVLIDAASHKHYVTQYRRNPQCRFDHASWQITRLTKSASQLTLQSAFDLRGRDAALHVEHQRFVVRLTCAGCGATRSLFHMKGRLRSKARSCKRCRRELLATGVDVRDPLTAAGLSETELSRSLSSLGFLAGDVFTLRRGDRESHYEIGGERA